MSSRQRQGGFSLNPYDLIAIPARQHHPIRLNEIQNVIIKTHPNAVAIYCT
jgi:hypothetical protein